MISLLYKTDDSEQIFCLPDPPFIFENNQLDHDSIANQFSRN